MKSEVWIAIGVLTVVCFGIKAAGPVALGGRDLPRGAKRLIGLLPAALLSALVVVQTFADGKALALDARAGRAGGGDGGPGAAGERARGAARGGADRGRAARADLVVWLASLHTYVECGHACSCAECRRALGTGAADCVSSDAAAR